MSFVSHFKPLTEPKEKVPDNTNPFALHGFDPLKKYRESNNFAGKEPEMPDSPRSEFAHTSEREEHVDRRESRSYSKHDESDYEDDHDETPPDKTFLEKHSTQLWITAFIVLIISGGWIYYQHTAYDVPEDRDLNLMMEMRNKEYGSPSESRDDT